MRIVIFSHSLVSDWNHGNAHFLRGLASELIARGTELSIFEPEDGWSRRNLIAQHGRAAVTDFESSFPLLRSTLYSPNELDLDQALAGAGVVLVHEWNDPELVARIGRHRHVKGGYQLFFHDTHHRMATSPELMAAYDLEHFDGVLAYGRVIRDLYLQQGLADCAWTWHEAADTSVFYPRRSSCSDGDLVWIGNWGDDERAQELREFLIEPVNRLGLKACVYGVRYPPQALDELAAAGIGYKGWLPNYRVPEVFARYRVTVHVPRRPYAKALPGIPTIRPFEALACGIPLISAPWKDSEHLFRPGSDFLFARNGDEMAHHLAAIVSDPAMAEALAQSGLETILRHHTCAHRVDELFAIAAQAGERAYAGAAH